MIKFKNVRILEEEEYLALKKYENTAKGIKKLLQHKLEVIKDLGKKYEEQRDLARNYNQQIERLSEEILEMQAALEKYQMLPAINATMSTEEAVAKLLVLREKQEELHRKGIGTNGALKLVVDILEYLLKQEKKN